MARLTVRLHPVSSLWLVASTPPSLQGGPDEQRVYSTGPLEPRSRTSRCAPHSRRRRRHLAGDPVRAVIVLVKQVLVQRRRPLA